ncbi:MAG: murein L,D-transpeptidase [Ignavibacteriae bacterium]|nr:murein L,D-transpeptidase [Ignavibacteriota bacterium]MCB9214863.1 murein L,D-transpeptidase [Ignavibacteria bacterium]
MKQASTTIAFLLLSGLLALHCNRPDLKELPQKVDIPSNQKSQTIVRYQKENLAKILRKKNVPLGAPIFIRIFKEENELEMWAEKDGEAFVLLTTWPICKWSGKLGPKLREGDRQSPEGFYYVTPSQMNPESNYHLAFDLGYPNAYDKSYGRTGSDIMVHGICGSLGCFAMTNPYIEEIWTMADAALRSGQSFFRVHIFPFRMSPENMERHHNLEWQEFWENLREGYDYFEREGRPPEVSVQNKEYVFNP